jgi:hypothetical protein
MQYKITQEIYDHIKSLVEEGQLINFEISPWHKGLDIAINDINSNPKFELLRSYIADLYYGNTLFEEGTYTPKIENDALVFYVSITDDHTYGGELKRVDLYYDDLIYKLYEYLGRIVDEEFNEYNFNLDIKIHAYSKTKIEIENFDLTYYNEDDDSNNSIILDPKIYDLVLETVQKWSASKIGISNNDDFNYYLTIEETEIQYFNSYSRLKLELNIVEKFK